MFKGCYFIDCKEGTKKKTGEWYGYVTLLYCDPKNFNQPVLENIWFDSKSDLESAIYGIPVGSAVQVKWVIGGGAPEFIINEHFVPIDFASYDD